MATNMLDIQHQINSNLDRELHDRDTQRKHELNIQHQINSNLGRELHNRDTQRQQGQKLAWLQREYEEKQHEKHKAHQQAMEKMRLVAQDHEGDTWCKRVSSEHALTVQTREEELKLKVKEREAEVKLHEKELANRASHDWEVMFIIVIGIVALAVVATVLRGVYWLFGFWTAL